MKSGGNGSSEVTLAAEAGMNSKLAWHVGSSQFELTHVGVRDQLVLSNGLDDLISIDRVSGATQIRGNLTVGGMNTTGSKHIGVVSQDATAEVEIKAGGSGDALISLVSPLQQRAEIQLSETGGHSFSLFQDGLNDRLVLSDGQPLVTVESTQNGGNITMAGNLAVGGLGVPGARTMTVESTNGTAMLTVQATSSGAARTDIVSSGQHDADLQLSAPANQDATITLSEGSNQFRILNQGASDRLLVNDGANDLLSIKRSTGETDLRGDMTVGGHCWLSIGCNSIFVGAGLSFTGNRSMTVHSGDSNASLRIQSGGGPSIFGHNRQRHSVFLHD